MAYVSLPRKLFYTILSIAILAPFVPAETIRSYDVEIAIDELGAMTIVENIEVMVEHSEIKHGIWRDFDVHDRTFLGLTVLRSLEVLSVTLDDQDEPYRFTDKIQELAPTRRMLIGDPNQLVPQGLHVYRLEYRTKGWLEFEEGRDRLRYNVIPHRWEFPIEKARVRIRLPGDHEEADLRVEALTGGYDSIESNWERIPSKEGLVELAILSPLRRQQGMTIEVEWPAGSVDRDAASVTLSELLSTNVVTLVSLFGFLVTLTIYLVAWLLVGRDPKPDQVHPRSAPPEGLSPAAARYLRQMRFDNGCMTAALFNAASKGEIEIGKEGEHFDIRKGNGTGEKLSADESVLLAQLLRNRQTLEVSQKNHARLALAKERFQQALQRKLVGPLFQENKGWLMPGIIATILTGLSGLLRGGFVDGGQRIAGLPYIGMTLFVMFFVTLLSVAVTYLAIASATTWKRVPKQPKSIPGAALLLALCCVMSMFLIGVDLVLSFLTSPWLAVTFPGCVALAIVFHRLLKAPTADGRALLDELSGYRNWLTTELPIAIEAQEGRPERMEQLMKPHVGYAIALDVVSEWSQAFREALATAMSVS